MKQRWTSAALVGVLGTRVATAGGITAWCREQNREFSVSFICDVLSGRRDMTPRLASALGFTPEPVTYRRTEGEQP